jgi:NAD(P)-dependent dehydrogenase (short-subunit alcohol dehydrogenase family)
MTATALPSFPPGGIAVVLGATGGIGGAVYEALAQDGRFATVVGLGRSGRPPFDLTDEASIAAAARDVAALEGELRLVFDATGLLQGDGVEPEKTWKQLDPEKLATSFAVNAIGPALVMKHFLPLLARRGKSVFATLSARVGSLGDNRLGGWYGYRASKAALNQFVRTAAVELARQRPDAVCLALHPGTVDTGLSAPHRKSGLEVRTPGQAARLLVGVLDRVGPDQTGGFLDYDGETIPW